MFVPLVVVAGPGEAGTERECGTEVDGTRRDAGAHTDPWPVATENGGTGKRIRATIAPSFSRDVDDMLVEFGGSDDVLVQQPDTATATLTAIAAARPSEIGALT